MDERFFSLFLQTGAPVFYLLAKKEDGKKE